MDITLMSRVVWRNRKLMAGIAVLAVLLAGLAFLKPAGGGLAYRQDESWVAYSQIYVTQQGCPECRSGLPVEAPLSPVAPGGGTRAVVPRFSDPARFSALAILLAQFATSDPVHAIVEKRGPVSGTVEAAALNANPNGTGGALPIIQIAGTAASRSGAVDLANREAQALIAYMRQRQDAAGVAAAQRLELRQIKVATTGKLVSGRSVTRPIVVLLAVLLLGVAIVFTRENLRQRRAAAAAHDGDAVAAGGAPGDRRATPAPAVARLRRGADGRGDGDDGLVIEGR